MTEIERNLTSLALEKSDKEDLLIGKRKNGTVYSVRQHRMNFLMPDVYKKVHENLPTNISKLTLELLIQTGARINEVRHIRKDDIDFERNNIKLRITKTKAKKNEKTGKPRTIPINSSFIKDLKKYFKENPEKEFIKILSTSAFNIALKKSLQNSGVKDYYMYSAHNIRKTHGNWLKILSNLKMINCDAMEICLRLGHDYNTFLKDYGSSGVMDSKDVLLVKEILGDLYDR